ncbi:MAG: hypothetical protein WA944_04525, partial [Mycobacterium sp.]
RGCRLWTRSVASAMHALVPLGDGQKLVTNRGIRHGVDPRVEAAPFLSWRAGRLHGSARWTFFSTLLWPRVAGFCLLLAPLGRGSLGKENVTMVLILGKSTLAV